MIAFPDMLISAAEKAGIKTPPNADLYDASEYPHFSVFCNAQLGASMPYAGCQWDNAYVIAKIPLDKIKLINMQELIYMGFQVGHPIP
jgi:hypothetical protein